MLDDLDLRHLSVAELLHVLLLGELVTHLEVALEVHALPLADGAGVHLPLGQILGDVLAPGLLGDQGLVHVLVQLVFLVEMLPLIFDAHAADDAVKQLQVRQTDVLIPGVELEYDVQKLFSRDEVDHLHGGTDNVSDQS